MHKGLTVKRTVFAGLMGAILFIGQVVLAGLPNIEIVSTLVLIFTLMDARLTRWAIGVFVLLQGLLYGFHLWWISYLYIWYVLHFAALATRKWMGPLFAALLCGLFGLAFGTLTSIPIFFTSGIGGGTAYIVAGVPFDIPHTIGNFVLTLLLYLPLQRTRPIFQRLSLPQDAAKPAP